jgi:hypothetical protein
VKKYALSVVLLLTLPAFATITDVQSNSNFACTSSPCSVTLNTQPHTTAGNLIAIWVLWQSSSAYTVNGVKDSNSQNNFVSAVGPTVQSVSSPPISAQIFYAPNIHPSPAHDQVTVTFSGSGSISAGVVAVEYSGLDQNFPLDSTSAGFSHNPGSQPDSGSAAPANANLLVFGGATNDSSQTSADTVAGFSQVQRSTDLKSVTEEMVVSGNQKLQRATAVNPVPPAGNWLMQMAIFRDAYQNTLAGSNPIPFCVAAGTTSNHYACSTSPSFIPAAQNTILFKADVANTGAATLNVNNTSAQSIAKQGGVRKPTRSNQSLPTRLTQRRRTEGRGKDFVFRVKAAPHPSNICAGCGATTRKGRRCPNCGRAISGEKLTELAKIGRVAAQSVGAQKRRSATQRRHEAAKRAWHSSAKPAWLNEGTYLEKIQPRLASTTISAVSSALGVSESYATDIRAGRRRPHPRHWGALAKLVGIWEMCKTERAGAVAERVNPVHD